MTATLAIGANIGRQRKALGLTVEALSSLASLPTDRIRSIEAGDDAPSTWDLDVIAGALAVEPVALRTGELMDPRWSVARFRGPLGVSFTVLDLRRLARCAEAGRIHAFLRRELGDPIGTATAVREVRPVHGEPWRHGYALGENARVRLVGHPRPLNSVQGTLEAAGVLVTAIRFDSLDIEGASLLEPDASPVIVLNRSVDRFNHRLARRAILAHELCHLLHDGGERDLLTVVSRSGDDDPIEQRAKGFAPSFIAPRHAIRVPAQASAKDKVVSLGTKWGLSFEGATWHAKNAGRITPDQANRLMARSSRPSIDPAGFEPDIVRAAPEAIGLELDIAELAQSALGDLAIRAVTEEIISTGRAAEILTLR